MATGSGPLGDNLPSPGVSNITPTYAVPDEGPLFRQIGDAFARLAAPVQDALDARVAQAGKKAGANAADQANAKATGGEVPADTAMHGAARLATNLLTHGAYEQAFNAAALARLKSDIDNHDEVLKGQFQNDPGGYKGAAQKSLSGFIQGAPEHLAVSVESYGQTKFAGSYAALSRVAEQNAAKDAAHAIGVRVKTLDDKLLGLASTPDGLNSDAFMRADAERTLLQIERTRNPAITYTPEDLQFDDARLYDSLHGAAAAATAASAYGEAGGGLPGKAAAYRVLENEILKGPALEGVDPGRRQRIYTDARKQIDDYSRADLEMQQQQAAADRQARAEKREVVGDLRLQAMLGGLSEKQVMARADITDADKSSIIAGIRAESRRERAEQRAAGAQERSARADLYRQYSDSAQAGTLSAAEIADGVNAGHLTPGQARTLAAKRDRSLAPVIEDVMAPVKDAASRPGHRASNEKMALAEEQATEWARQNPSAPLDLKLKAGEVIAKRVFGAKGPGPAAGGPNAARAAEFARLKQDRQAGRISASVYLEKLKALANGN
jgi:hypothetical protein